MFKLDLEKAEEPEIKLPTSIDSQKKEENSGKTSTSALLIMPKTVIDCRSQQTVENSSRDGNNRKFLPASWETCMQVQKQQLEPDM